MAIFQQRVPQPKPPDDYAARVIVRFKPDVNLPFADAQSAHAKTFAKEWDALHRKFADVELTHALAPMGADAFAELERRLARVASRATLRPTSYFALVVPKAGEAAAVAALVVSWPHVETAYVESVALTPPNVMPDDDPLSPGQGYLNSADQGMDARWIWQERNVDGTGASFVDIEQGWLLDHEDLPKPDVPIIGGINLANFGHGAAVLGILVGVDNQIGVIGLAPNASPHCCSQWFKFKKWKFISTGFAMSVAMTKMSPGDVMILETTAAPVPKLGWVPVETDDWEYSLIRAATDMGIVVVEAAGNNSFNVPPYNPPVGSNLDEFRDKNLKYVISRLSPDFRDSGAIMVGAAYDGVPHARTWFSNYGSRVDCYAWGWNIPCVSDGGPGGVIGSGTTPLNSYFLFAGTSGATAQVSGAALLLQSWARSTFGSPLSPDMMRALLSNSTINTKSVAPTTDLIGVMPNLQGIVTYYEVVQAAKAVNQKYAELLLILFGIIQDGGGLGITPGGVPIHIGPWGPDGPIGPFAGGRRDLAVGGALTTIAGTVGDKKLSAQISALGASITQRALGRIEQR